MLKLEKNLNALLVVILSCILLGGFGMQFIKDERPCPLCLLQRLGMIGVAIGALLNIKFGIKKSHYGLSLLAAIMGATIALRHIALHVCPGYPTFGKPFMGLSLYTWSFITFASAVTYISLLLLCFTHEVESKGEPQRLNMFYALALTLIFLVAFANIFTTLGLCGFGVCE